MNITVSIVNGCITVWTYILRPIWKEKKLLAPSLHTTENQGIVYRS